MSDGWIKLHRRILDNEVFRFDPTAWRIFEYLMLRADVKTGTVKTAYGAMAEYLDISKATLHKAVRRLKTAKMVDDLVNGRFTTFSICNWHKYQGDGERHGRRPVNARETPGERPIYRNNKNKELRSEKSLTDFFSTDLQPFREMFETRDVAVEHQKACDWLRSTGKRYRDYAAFFRNWLQRAPAVRQAKPWQPPAEQSPVDERGLRRLRDMKRQIFGKDTA